MLSGHGTGIQREPLHFYSYWCKYECMYVVFLLNKKHCFGYIIHVWCLIPVTYVSGKLHLYKYVAWCMKYSVTGNKSCVYIHFIPPPPLWRGVEGLYPICDLAFGVLQWSSPEQSYWEVAMSWEKWINRHTRLTSLALGNNRAHNRLLKKKMDLSVV